MPIGWRPTHPGDPTPKRGLSKAGRLVIAITVAVGIAIALAIIVIRPADASDRVASPTMPQEATPVPLRWLGGRVEMLWAGIAVTYPEEVRDFHVVVSAPGDRAPVAVQPRSWKTDSGPALPWYDASRTRGSALESSGRRD